jgi:hypothetical protein
MIIAIYFWLACLLTVLAGTCYWFGTARHGPNKESERLGLLLLYVLLGLVTAVIGGILWVGCRAFQGFTPH